jgi:hypothetical protein
MKTSAAIFSVGISLLALTSAQHSFAQGFNHIKPKTIRVNHIPETTTGLNKLEDGAKSVNHIQLVNVGEAVAEEDWDIIVRYVAKTMPLNFWTNSIQTTIIGELISGNKRQEEILGKHASIAVFVEKTNSRRPSFLSSPGRWASVDISKPIASATDKQNKNDRIAKYLIKAIAYAIGGGVSMESNSTLSGRVVSLAQLDQTPISVPPMSLFPLVEAANALSGGTAGTAIIPE